MADHRLQFCRQGVVLALVEQDLEGLGVLVIRLDHVVLGHVREAEHAVGGWVVELRAVDHATLERRHDLAARKRCHGRAHRIEQVGREADGAVLQPAHLLGIRDRGLEPAERLGRHRPGLEADHVHPQHLADELVVQRLAAAVVEPREVGIGVVEPRRRRAEQAERLVLAEPIGRDAVPAIERAGGDRVDQLEGADHRAGGEQFHAHPPAGHGVHAADEVAGEFVEDVALRPGRLEPPGHGLRAADAGRCQDGCGGGARRGGLQESTTCRHWRLGLGHAVLPDGRSHLLGRSGTCCDCKAHMRPTWQVQPNSCGIRPATSFSVRPRGYFVTKAFSTT
jgi:hypothetical protein